MASKDNEVPQPIIIKKVKKGGGGHHGGAWKVAYADFVTAMMAFFLLMWLLNVTTKEQKNAISNYFDPTHPRVSSELSGSGGILGGMTMSPEGAQVSNVQNIATPQTPTTPQQPEVQIKQSPTVQNDANLQDGLNILDEVQNIEDAELDKLQAVIEEQQNQDFEAIKQTILEEVSKSPELADLMDHLMIDITPEGLRIQIIDKEGRSMFPIGSANMYGFMNQLVGKVTQVIIPQPNKISVRGHTDGKKYPEGAVYNNWNLSSDRALASRKAMMDANLSPDRIDNVIGKADREHLLPDDPLSPRNRRISIVLLRQQLENAEAIRKAAAEVVQKRQEQQQAIPREDRENIPALDQRINGSNRELIIEDDTKPPLTDAVQKFEENGMINDNPDTGNMVGDEIQKMRNQETRQTSPVLSSPVTSTDDDNETQILQFP